MQVARPLVLEPSFVAIETAIRKLERYEKKALIKFQRN